MSNQSANNKRIAKNTVFLYIRMGLVLIISLYTTRVVLKALGVVDYGIYNVVGGLVSMFAFLSGSMSNAIQRFYNYHLGGKEGRTITEVYNTALLIQVSMAFVLFILIETVGNWYMHIGMVIPTERFGTAMWIFHFSVLSMIINILNVPHSAAIMAYERMNYFAYVSIFDVTAKLIVAYLLISCDVDRLFLYGTLNLVIALTSFFLNFSYCRYNFKELTIRLKVNKVLFKSMLSFSSWNLLETFAYMIKGQGLNMLLNVFFGPIVNAARGISSMIMGAIQGFQINIVVAFRPQIIRSYSEGNFSHVKKLFYSLSKISFVLLSILSIPIILEIDYILSLWLGNTIPNYTKPFTILILVNLIISSLNTPVSQVVHATGKVKNYDIATSVVICAILPISWVCLKLGCNPNSVYIISLIVTILNQIICNLFLKKVFAYSLREYCKKVIIPCLFFLLTVPIIPFCITLLYDPTFMRLIIIIILSLLISFIAAYYAIFDKYERNVLKGFVKKRQKN